MFTQRLWMRTGGSLGWPKRVAVCLGVIGLIVGGWMLVSEAAAAPAPGGANPLPRMFDGAPPQIPHDVKGLEGLCLGCHLEGVQGAPIVPHPDRPACRQCHVTRNPLVKPLVMNALSGKPVPPPK